LRPATKARCFRLKLKFLTEHGMQMLTQTLPGGKLAAYRENSTGLRMRIGIGSMPIGACWSDPRD
jgi:hypothetical protein